MSKIEDDAYLRRTRATWIAGKTGMNYAKANAIMQNYLSPTPKEEKKITKAIHKDRRAPLYKKHTGGEDQTE